MTVIHPLHVPWTSPTSPARTAAGAPGLGGALAVPGTWAILDTQTLQMHV